MNSKHLLFFVICLLACACNKNNCEKGTETGMLSSVNSQIKLTGKIKLQLFSYHQYGSHFILSDSTYYALTSSTIDLNDFIGTYTTLIGNKIPGYPINPGIDPDFIEVIAFE